MKLKEKNMPEKSKKPTSSIVLYGAFSVVALIAVALLINNIILFKNTVNLYVDQGYLAADVIKQLIPSQLLPGIFEPIAVYGGIAFVLLGAAIINQKVSKCLILLTKVEVCNDAIEDSDLVENVIYEEVNEATDKSQINTRNLVLTK